METSVIQLQAAFAALCNQLVEQNLIDPERLTAETLQRLDAMPEALAPALTLIPALLTPPPLPAEKRRRANTRRPPRSAP